MKETVVRTNVTAKSEVIFVSGLILAEAGEALGCPTKGNHASLDTAY